MSEEEHGDEGEWRVEMAMRAVMSVWEGRGRCHALGITRLQVREAGAAVPVT